jgi:hypothetical protein
MRYLCVLAAIILLCPFSLRSQPFMLVDGTLPALSNSCAVWGDYDNDGDLDFVIAGEPGSTLPKIHIMRNDDGTFTDTGAPLQGLSLGSVQWGDFDGDGDLDILVMGRDNSDTSRTRIYINNGGEFTDSGIALKGLVDGEAAWGDYDNDGDLDILMAGRSDGLHFYAMILRNDGGLFTDIDAHLTGVQAASVCWVDYNNDGLADVMLNGDSGGGFVSRLYKNTGNGFEEVTSTGFTALGNGQVRWADLDLDGDKDLVITGTDDFLDGKIFLYKNEGNDSFTLDESLTQNLSYTAVDISDYNNDGLPDIVLTGKIQGCGGTAVTMLYRNDGFWNFFEESTLIPGFKQGSVMWGDYNNDGYPDLLLTGFNGYDSPVTSIYRNNLGSGIFTTNTPPSVPAGLTVTTSGQDATFTWNQATDDQTPKAMLTYNVLIGTTPTSSDVLSPMSAISTGLRQVVTPGNAGQDTTWTIKDLPAGDYYWSVQGVDNGFLGSVFPPSQEFSITANGLGENSRNGFSAYPCPAVSFINLEAASAGEYQYDILNITGKEVMSGRFTGKTHRIGTEQLPAGYYIIRIGSGSENSTLSFIRSRSF